MKILITGGSGFVGTNLTRFLLDKGHRIRAVGRSEPRHLFDHENYRFIAADTTTKAVKLDMSASPKS